jgi:hypothetical protein
MSNTIQKKKNKKAETMLPCAVPYGIKECAGEQLTSLIPAVVSVTKYERFN